MGKLATWIEEHREALVTLTTGEMSPSEELRDTVVDAVQAFYDGLLVSSKMNTSGGLKAILLDWVESRSAPTEEELIHFVPVLLAIKRVIFAHLAASTDGAEAWPLIRELNQFFDEAVIFLGKLEAEALLRDAEAQLEQARAELRMLDKSKSDFIAVAAHELKTPLTLIEGYSDMLRSAIPQDEYPQTPLMLKGIANGVARLKSIVQDMIDVSLIDADLLELSFQPLWPRRLIELVRGEIEDMLAQRDVELIVEPAEALSKMTYGDPGRLCQVIRSVVTNAV